MNTERGNGGNENMAEMPRYQSHKKVWALKIKSIVYSQVERKSAIAEDELVALMVPEDSRYASIGLTYGYTQKHKPKEGGYYVVYEDGYKSWSPAEAFESGYSREETNPEVSAAQTTEENSRYNPTCAISGKKSDLQMYALRNEKDDMIGWVFLNEKVDRNQFDISLKISKGLVAPTDDFS